MAPGRLGDGYGGYRTRLVEQLRAAGIKDLAVLRAVAETPRHLFVPSGVRHRAYDDGAPLPIGHGQTISQPSTQARYLGALELRGGERVLEIGTGSGYQAALLTRLAGPVFSVERVPELAASARAALAAANTVGVTVLVGDGSLGWRSCGPFDAILVSAVSPVVPDPLVEQLADGGRLLIPLQTGDAQQLHKFTRRGTNLIEEALGSACFVPLVGRHGFPLKE